MYGHTLHHEKKSIFVVIVFQAFNTEEILKIRIKDCYKINGKERILMPKGEYVKFKIYEGEINPPFVISADFESILVPENNRKKNPEEP